MNINDTIKRIYNKFPGGSVITSSEATSVFPSITVSAAAVIDVLTYLKEEASLSFEFLETITGVHTGPENTGYELMVIYHLLSLSRNQRLNVKVLLKNPNLEVQSVTSLWAAAEFPELELTEMFGVTVNGHPAPRPFLLASDWVGHPLRKDYVFPETYHGIEHRRAPLRKAHERP